MSLHPSFFHHSSWFPGSNFTAHFVYCSVCTHIGQRALTMIHCLLQVCILTESRRFLSGGLICKVETRRSSRTYYNIQFLSQMKLIYMSCSTMIVIKNLKESFRQAGCHYNREIFNIFMGLWSSKLGRPQIYVAYRGQRLATVRLAQYFLLPMCWS